MCYLDCEDLSILSWSSSAAAIKTIHDVSAKCIVPGRYPLPPCPDGFVVTRIIRRVSESMDLGQRSNCFGLIAIAHRLLANASFLQTALLIYLHNTQITPFHTMHRRHVSLFPPTHQISGSRHIRSPCPGYDRIASMTVRAPETQENEDKHELSPTYKSENNGDVWARA